MFNANVSRRMFRVLVVSFALLSAMPAFGQGGGIMADPLVESLSYTELVGQDPVETWHLVNEIDFWAVPRTVPEGYYDGVDTGSAAALRASLHATIRAHHVYPYTHPSRPGFTNHRVDTWDIVMLADAHPEQPDRVLDIYLNATFDRQLGGVTYDPR